MRLPIYLGGCVEKALSGCQCVCDDLADSTYRCFSVLGEIEGEGSRINVQLEIVVN